LLRHILTAPTHTNLFAVGPWKGLPALDSPKRDYTHAFQNLKLSTHNESGWWSKTV
jgi:hypothetical protein